MEMQTSVFMAFTYCATTSELGFDLCSTETGFSPMESERP